MLLPGVILGACLLGVLLLVKGTWPRRRGSMPVCRRCSYNLTGLSTPRCPECGSLLTLATVVLGERRRSPRRIVLGTACLSVGAFIWYSSPRIDFYTRLPAFLILRELES